jgi:phosphohistidine phosphatase
MRSLLLMRHARAAESADDHARPLDARGRAEAAGVASLVAARGLAPTRVLCSSARRAVETLEAMRRSLPPAQVDVDRALYLAGSDLYLERIRAVPGDEVRILVVGHNPGLGILADTLAAGGEPGLVRRLATGFPTATVAVFEVESGWSELAPDRARLVALLHADDARR